MTPMDFVIAVLIGLYTGTTLRQVRDFKRVLAVQTAKIDELLAEINRHR